ncbi:predicted protein [Phaeodactylum tricornutum CCAP 1055/1]|uniref:Uncharacterized protein n=1 Tax=Phaeodactylum tricornutum (strain CCAP 1055/1) TaxID=556484 RepID=B7S3Z8_PHATC|nr:predicted protein [Phaeodactylum tricornutum CCAP 1055/1]EEC42679.1 predicted protein [Phaeodactylum tricornutum CCAP 1055/1]|eukprot:XP_002176287.1 predicted protein [Phaeodactylum tricornutum CCAP 1055/1]
MAADGANAFRGALGRIGWSVPAANAFTNEGFDAMDSLGLVTCDRLKDICKIIRRGTDGVAAVPAAGGNAAVAAAPGIPGIAIPMMWEYKLSGMHLWVSERLQQGTPVVAADFTAAIGNLYTRKVRELEEAKDEEDVQVKPPAPFSKQTKWIPFFKLLVNYLSSVTGVNKVPLDYVVRKDDDVAAPDTEFEMEHEKLVLLTPHTGTAFDKDNGKVWIQALNCHYEGDAVMSKSKAAAFDVLEHTTYTGERRHFGMEKYTNALSTAFQTLDEYGETLTESRKMLSGIAVIQGDADRMSNFAKAADYLALFTNTDTSQKTGRSISSAQRTSNNKKKPAIRAGNYTPNEWHQLSDKEKDKVRAKRAAAKPLATRTSAQLRQSLVRMLSATLVRGLMKLSIAGLRSSKRWTKVCGDRGIGRMISGSRSSRFEGQVDLDSHADTCIMGKVFHIYSATGQKCTVMPYSDKYKPRVVEVADGCTAFDDPVTGETFILDVFQALDMTGDLQDPSLLCPNQLRANGLIVDNVPKHLCHNRESTHSIYIPEMKLRISLELQGVMSGFQARLPTQTEIETCVHVKLTAQEAWDPSSDELEQQERLKETRLSNVAGTVSTLFSGRKSEISAVLSSVSSMLVDDDFVCGMEQSVRITLAVASSTVCTKSRHSTMEPMELSCRWGIGLSTAQKTLKTMSEPLTPWQNRAESEIRELKKQVLCIMSHEGIPQRFWDYVAEYVSEIRSRTAHPLYNLKGRTPIEHVTGETPDIMEWLEYRMYQPVWYLDPGDFPEEKKLLGRWLGPAHRVGQAFCCWIVPKSGRVIARSTVQPVSEDERGLDSFKTRLKDFDKSVQDFLNRGDTHLES